MSRLNYDLHLNLLLEANAATVAFFVEFKKTAKSYECQRALCIALDPMVIYEV